MDTRKIPQNKNNPDTTEKKLRNVRTCLYILVLAAITKFAMTDFQETTFRTWISAIVIFLIITLVVIVERSLRRKLIEERSTEE